MRIPSLLAVLVSACAVLLGGCAGDEYEDLSTLHEQFALGPNSIVAEASAVYLSVGSRVEKRDEEGANPAVLSAAESLGAAPAAAYELTLSGVLLYWLRATSPTYDSVLPASDLRTEVVRVPTAGGTPEVVARLAGAPTRRFAVNGDTLVTCDVPVPSGKPVVSFIGIAAQTRATYPASEDAALGCADLFIDASGSAHASIQMSLTSKRWVQVNASGTATAEGSPPSRPGVRWKHKSDTSNEADLVSTDAAGAETILTSGYDVPFVAEGSTVYLMSGAGGGNRKTLECNTGGVSVIRNNNAPELLTKGQCGLRAVALTGKRGFWLDDRSILYADGKPESSLKSLTR